MSIVHHHANGLQPRENDHHTCIFETDSVVERGRNKPKRGEEGSMGLITSTENTDSGTHRDLATPELEPDKPEGSHELAACKLVDIQTASVEELADVFRRA